ncbi:CXXC-type zinc finger protein 1 [Cryptotermes secundus]|uniref:CXXC-type zinc finger protein 1 n=1 Tax=Cryptotermes secundus TaxID=105785 RepID=A0A2J7Q781_9NEOP|nr:CXXC-type zinc finger protein 1 isoform X2 [Cryptotermes secundus]PNF24443.1 CXXC-type zinc finger protein 1 [Cryptotermes secundus]
MTDKEYVGLSKEEIARQFMLPERKSKIATLLKQDGQAYCICRSSDSSRFMIGCDNCEEWYHGDCIRITEKESKYIKQFFCVRCREEDPTLVTKYKPRKREGERTTPGTEERKAKRRKDKLDSCEILEDNNIKPLPLSSPLKRCGKCLGCYRTDDCGRCDGCRSANRARHKCRQRQCLNNILQDVDQSQKVRQSSSVRRKRKDSSSDGGERWGGAGSRWLQSDKPRQCYGPACVRAARPGSKYCSDDCGLKLATNRIYQVLPQRIQEWALSPCAAEESNKRALESVRKHQLEVRRILQELDKRHKELDAIIERAKMATVELRSEEDSEDEGEMSMYCITCGHEIHSRMAIKHMEKCFNKYESQSSFGSIYKTRIEGNNMFCDYYNPSSRTYCKRLRVLCPEHSKDPKVNDTEVCGCPLVTNVFDLTGEFCRAPKKSCLKHYCWEKLRRAEIDMERVRQWLKIDELIEQERQIRHLMASRAGVLALMLHSTYNHDLMEQMTSAQDQQQLAAMEEEMQRRYGQQQQQQQQQQRHLCF